MRSFSEKLIPERFLSAKLFVDCSCSSVKPFDVARVKFAFAIVALSNLALSTSASAKLVPTRLAFVKSAFVAAEFAKLALVSAALLKSTPVSTVFSSFASER